jgi:hypothetical protein
VKKLLPFLLLFFAGPVKAQTLAINQFGGINTDDSPLTLENGQSPDSRNLLTDDGPGVQGRKGFVRYSTEPSSGLWEFPLSNGTRYLISSSGGNLKATTDGTFSTFIATVPTDRVTAAAVLGDKFFFSDTLNGLRYWNGASVTSSSNTMTFDKLVTFKGRLVGAGKSGSERILFLSKYLDGTNWTLVTNPSDDDPSQITVSGSLDETIQALYSTFQDKLIYFKKNSFGGLSGSRRSNFALRVYSDSIGVSSVETIRDCDGRLRWLGNNRKVYQFDGATFGIISEDIDNIFANVSQGDANSRSITLTTDSDFAPGTFSPTDYISTSVISGSVALATSPATIFVDSISTDFAAGTLTNLSTTVINGSLVLSTFTSSGFTNLVITDTGSLPAPNNDIFLAQSFTTPSTYTKINTATFFLQSTDGGGCSPVVSLYTFNADINLGTLLATGSIINLFGTPGSRTSTFSSSPILSPSTKYVLRIASCASPNYGRIAYKDPGTYAGGDFGNSGGAFGSGDSSMTVTYTAAAVSRTSGSIVSQTFDVGITTNSYMWKWGNLTANGTIPTGSSITYQTQTSSDATHWAASVAASTGSTPTSTVQRYIRYIATFTASDQTVTPQLDDVTVQTTDKRRPAGFYISPAIDFGLSVSSVGTFAPTSQTLGGSITYQFQTSTNSSTSLFLSTAWVTVLPGALPVVPAFRYAAVRSSFSATSGTETLSLDVLQFNFTEGSNIRASSSYINSRYWLGLAISSTSNNGILVYDKQNQWQRYDAYVPEAMTIYNSRMYVGNTNGVFLSESGYSDNGTPITGYYTTKTLTPAGYDYFGQYDHLYLTTDNSDDVLTPTFQINNNATDNSFGATAMNGSLGIQNLKYPFSMAEVQQGKFINMKWSVTGSSFWRILQGDLYFLPSATPD